jgi:ribonucleoside-triphosphate reductase (formate)
MKKIKAACGNCRSENVIGMSRVVGYYSIIENWNESKQAELVDRQKGSYKLSHEELLGTSCQEMKQEIALVR